MFFARPSPLSPSDVGDRCRTVSGSRIVNRHVCRAPTSRESPFIAAVRPSHEPRRIPSYGGRGVVTIADVMLTMRPKAPLPHGRQHSADQHQRRDHVRLNRLQPAVALDVGEKLPGDGPAVVIDEDIGRGTGREQLCLPVRGRDIGGNRDPRPPRATSRKAAADFVELRLLAPVDQDMDAFLALRPARQRQSQPPDWMRKRWRYGLSIPKFILRAP